MTEIRVSTVLFDADGVLQDPVERWRPAFGSKFSLAGDNLDTLVQSVIATELDHLTRNEGFPCRMLQKPSSSFCNEMQIHLRNPPVLH